MKLLSAVLFLITLSLSAEPEGFRIASWNLKNYLQQNRWAHERYRFDYPKPEAEKAIIRRTLLQVRPDLLLLQELGSEAFLRELQEDLAAGGLVYPYGHFASLPEARSGLALLSRVPLETAMLLDPHDADDESRLQRGVQKLRFRHGSVVLRIFHVHLKSRYTTDEADPDSVAFRTRELALLGSLLETTLSIAGKSDRFLLAGDFNSPFDSPILESLRAEWVPLRPLDARKEAWTYHHYKTGRRETIDGFWQPQGQTGFHPVGLFPLTRDRPIGSDHRLVVIEWRAERD